MLTIQTIISEVGLNHDKWPSEKHFTSWLGLSPANKVTGKKYLGRELAKLLLVLQMLLGWLPSVCQEATVGLVHIAEG
ncbi:hypothetical protein wKueTS_12310 [Wolbachia pipientis]